MSIPKELLEPIIILVAGETLTVKAGPNPSRGCPVLPTGLQVRPPLDGKAFSPAEVVGFLNAVHDWHHKDARENGNDKYLRRWECLLDEWVDGKGRVSVHFGKTKVVYTFDELAAFFNDKPGLYVPPPPLSEMTQSQALQRAISILKAFGTVNGPQELQNALDRTKTTRAEYESMLGVLRRMERQK